MAKFSDRRHKCAISPSRVFTISTHQLHLHRHTDEHATVWWLRQPVCVIKTIPLQHSALSKFLSILDSCLENLPARTPSFTIIYAIEIWLLSGHRLGEIKSGVSRQHVHSFSCSMRWSLIRLTDELGKLLHFWQQIMHSTFDRGNTEHWFYTWINIVHSGVTKCW